MIELYHPRVFNIKVLRYTGHNIEEIKEFVGNWAYEFLYNEDTYELTIITNMNGCDFSIEPGHFVCRNPLGKYFRMHPMDLKKEFINMQEYNENYEY